MSNNLIFPWVDCPEEEENKKRNMMSESMFSLHGIFRGRRRHPELFPAMPRERIFASSSDRLNKELVRPQTSDSVKNTPKRAVSMTRLDQLAQPRRRYLEETVKSKNTLSGNNPINQTNCLSNESMSYVNPGNNFNKSFSLKPSPTPALRTGTRFKSMTQLSMKTSPNIDNNCKSDNKPQNYSYFCNENKEKSKSMVHLLARPPPPPPPRQTRASKLRTLTQSMSRSSMSLNTDSLSPTRPISSMSSSTDGSIMEVKRRVKPSVPRKPRPISIGSPYAVKQKVEDKDVTAARESRMNDNHSHPTPPIRPNRARSAGGTPRPLSLVSPDTEPNGLTPKPTPPRKPAHVKAAAMARKAIKQSSSDVNLSDKTNSSSKSKNNKTESTEEVVPEKQNEETIAVPSVEPKPAEVSASESPNPESCDNDLPSNGTNNSKKDVSEEDYKKMMAEKRRLAREQAEREAEAERLRIEKERQEEEERIRREEEEQRKHEEEQLRLIELQRRAEEERLRKAVEENRLREEEENKRKAEELRLRLEREEKDKKAKEEAEKQRLELEERLKRDEEERLQRKKKLEAIMSRTRKSPAVRGSSPNETPEPQMTDSNTSTPEKVREVAKNQQNILKNEQKEDNLVIIKTNASDINNSVANNHPKPDLVEDANRAVLQNRKTDQNNGVSSVNGSNLNNNNNNHIESQRFDDNLLDMNSMSSVSDRSVNEVNESLDQLIVLNYSTSTTMEDVFNSNHVSSNAFITTNGSNIKSQEQTITDLLS